MLKTATAERARAGLLRCRELGKAWDYTKITTWKNQRDVERALAALPDHQQELDAFSEAIGQGFLALASSLENMTVLSERLVPESEQLLRLSNGDFEGEAVLESSAEILKPVFDFLDECVERQREIAKRLEFCRSNIRELLALQSSLAAVIEPLNYIETLFKIECAVLPESVQALFVSVTSEITQLEKKVEAMFAEKFTALTAIDRSLSDVLERLSTSLNVLTRLVGQGRKDIDATLLQLTAQLAQNEQRHGRLINRTRQIADRVNAIVTGLQAHDIVSQKIGHVVRDFGEFAEQEPSLRSIFTRRQRLQLANELARVQTRQIEAVAHESRQGQRQISRSVEAVLDAVDAVHENFTALEEYRAVTVATEAMISGLLAGIQSVGTMVTQTLGEADNVFKVIASIGQSADALTATIMELSISMHFIALNAQIQAVQIGAGTGLEMLSARTAELSAETSTLSEQARQGLDRIARVMKEIIDDFSLLRSEGDELRRSLNERGSAMQKKLQSLGRVTKTSFHSIENATAGIQEHCQAMREALPSEEAIFDALAPTQDFLGELRRLTSVTGVGEARTLSAEERFDLKNKYTMESERAAHEGAITGEVAAIEAALKNSGDGIELFAEADSANSSLESTKMPAETANAIAETATASTDGSIELF